MEHFWLKFVGVAWGRMSWLGVNQLTGGTFKADRGSYGGIYGGKMNADIIDQPTVQQGEYIIV